MDIILDNDGDLKFNADGDFILANSITQRIKIKLQWSLNEWKWNREKGLPYFEELLIKNPDVDYFKGVIREAIFDIPEVTAVQSVDISIDSLRRSATIRFAVLTDEESIKGEVILDG